MKIVLENLEELSYSKKEAYNSLRTNIRFCGANIKVIAFTSCTPDEGKSITVLELARSMAENSRKVLMIDADMRKSVMLGRHRIKGDSKKKEMPGLSHYLSGQAELKDVIYETNIENLDMILVGRLTQSPTELLDTDNFRNLIAYGRENYDVVLVDTPPLGSVIDTAVIAPEVDGVVIVVEANKCSYRFVQDIKKQIELTDTRILGVVLNKVRIEKNGYYKGYYNGYYSKYGKYGYGENK